MVQESDTLVQQTSGLPAPESNKDSSNGHYISANMQPDNDIILIESDDDQDRLTVDENRPVRLIQDRRVGRPRDSLNRFVNQNGTNRAILRRLEINNGENTNTSNDNSDDDDGVEIVSTRDTQRNNDGPIYPETEYIDLEDDNINNDNNTRSRVLSLNHGGQHTDHNEDDGLMIMEERTTHPTVTLTLPGGEHLQIDATTTDRPIRSSFEWQEELPETRRRLLRRSGRSLQRAARSIFYDEEDSDNDNNENPNGGTRSRLPRNIRRLHQQQEARIGDIERRRRQQNQDQSNLDSRNPVLEQIRRRIQTYPPDVRSSFDHAQSLHEFRSILQNIAPVTLQECGDELTSLFTQYRSHLMENWAAQRVQTARDDSRRTRLQQRPPPGHNIRRRLRDRYNGMTPEERLIGLIRPRRNRSEDRLNDSDEEFREGFISVVNMMNGNFDYDDLNEYDYDYDYVERNQPERENERTQNIINMIQEREERERDARVKNFMLKTKTMQENFHEKAKNLPDGYSANFDIIPKMKLNIVKNGEEERVIVDDDDTWQYQIDVPTCALCGVELGVGIPDDFLGISKDDRGLSFEYLVDKYQYHCPFQSLLKPTQLDRDLSKRTYIANCGHTFCGRCYVRIENAKARIKMSKKKLAELKGSSNPDNYGPKKCPAADCKGILRAKGKMREMYL